MGVYVLLIKTPDSSSFTKRLNIQCLSWFFNAKAYWMLHFAATSLFFWQLQDSEHLLAEGLFASCRMRQLGGFWLYWSGPKDAVSYHRMLEAQVGS